ncbi:hypothetical protein, partial [Desulfosarcina cetonica]
MKTPNVNSWWNNLVTNFVFRMMISGLLLSIFWGGVVYIYQTHQVKKELFQQLEKVSRNLISGQSVPLNKMDTRVFNKIIEISARQLTDFRIVMLDLYDVGHLSIFHYDNGSEDIKAVEGQKTKLKATPFSDQNE